MPDPSNISNIVSSLTPEELAELKVLLGVRKSTKKPVSPEFLAAKAALDEFAEANELVVTEYNRLKEVLRGIKGTRKVLATKSYTFNPATSEVTSKSDGSHICTHGEEGWQSAMRSSGYTVGQVAGVSKSAKAAATSEQPAE